MSNKLSGFDELSKKLTLMQHKTEKNVKKLKEDTVEVGIKTAQERVPVDTGELKNSIKETKEGMEVDAKHAVHVEYGTFKTPAQPYFRPAYEEMKDFVDKNIRGVVDDTK